MTTDVDEVKDKLDRAIKSIKQDMQELDRLNKKLTSKIIDALKITIEFNAAADWDKRYEDDHPELAAAIKCIDRVAEVLRRVN